jgi:hypothetical protein
MEFMGHSL